MAITDDVITATTQLLVTDGPAGPVFADVLPAAGKAYVMGKLGVGTINPQNKLDIEGAAAIGAAYSGGAAAPANGLLVEGNVGIGTATPAAKLEVAGALRVTQDAALLGNVGVGTTTPQAKLQVAGGAFMPSAGGTTGAGILFPPNPGGGAGDAAWMRYYVRAGESTTLEIGVANDVDDHIALMSSGNVGIGTVAPANKLDVIGDIAVHGKHALRGNDTWLRLNQDGAFASGVHTPGNFAPGSLNVGGAAGWGNPGTGNAWVTGAVGIGTTTAQRRLHVHGDAWTGNGAAEIHASGATAGFSFTNRDAGRVWDNGGAGERWVLYSFGKVAKLWTSGVGDRLWITTDGHLEFQGDLRIQAGKTIYGRGRMHVHGEELLYLLNKSGVVVSKAWGGTGDLTVEGNATVHGQTLTVTGHWLIVHGAGGEQAYLGGDGAGNDVQIGSFNPTVSTVGFWNGPNGTWMNARAKAFLTSSDARLKTNIEPVHGALEKVLKLNAVKFDWVDEAGKGEEGKRIGLIAQDVLEVLPEAVSKDSKGMYCIADAPLVSILIEAMKEHNARLERLETCSRS